jgi:hypothetical protein
VQIFAPDADAGLIVREHVDTKKPDARRDPPSHFFRGTMKIGRISVVIFRVANMERSVPFYRDVLGMEIIYGSEDAYLVDAFWASLREKGFHPESPQDASWGCIFI